MSFEAESENGQGAIHLQRGDDVELQVGENVRQAFALSYLLRFTKATPLSRNVTIRMSEDVPVVVEYQLEGIGSLSFYLAPKIEDADG